MGKFFRFVFCALMLLVGAKMSAQDLSFTLVANPAHISAVTGGSPTEKKALSFSEEGTVNTLDFSGSYFYISVEPKANVKYSVKIYDSEDNLVATVLANKTVATQGFAFVSKLQGNKVVVESELDLPSFLTITVNGTASNVKASFGGSSVGTLKKGENRIRIENSFLNITSTKAGKKFYHVTYNGVEKAPSVDVGEGSAAVYNYFFSSPKNGDKIVIDVDFPVGPWDISLDIPAGCEEFVNAVTVDGVKVPNWQSGFQVTGGQTVRVQGDRYDYLVHETSINGVPTAVASTSAEVIVEGNTTIGFDVTKIKRDKQFVLYTGANTSTAIRTSLDSYKDFGRGYTLVPFCDEDNPVIIHASSTSTDQNTEYVGHYYLNDVPVESGSLFHRFAANDGDVLKVVFVKDGDAPASYDVRYRLSNLKQMPKVVKDYVRPVSGQSDNVLAGTLVSISSSPQARVKGVKVNGSTLTAENGVYSFTVNADMSVEIEGASESDPETSEFVTLGATGMSSFVSRNVTSFVENGEVKAYIATGITNSAVKLQQVTGNVPAGTGLMLTGKANETVEIPFGAVPDANVRGNLQKGVFQGGVIPASAEGSYTYVFGTKDNETGFWLLTKDMVSSNGNHAYIISTDNWLANGVRALSLDFGDETGIQSASAESDQQAIYTLSGIKVANTSKPGLYIVRSAQGKNGKKMVVK